MPRTPFSTSRVALGALVGVAALASACAPDPQRDEARRILKDMLSARAELVDQTNVSDACLTAHGLRVEIYGVPGQSRIGATWALLDQANQSLMGACGASQLATAAAPQTPTDTAAQQRWQADARDLLGQMCAPMAAAARDLGAPPPAC